MVDTRAADATQYRSASVRALWVYTALALFGIAACFSIWATWEQLSLVGDALRGQRLDPVAAAAADDRSDVSDLLYIATFAGSALLFLSWLWRAHRNLEALGVSSEYTSRGALLWWFVPIANLFKPYRVVSEVSDNAAPWIEVWWASWVLSGFVSIGVEAIWEQPDDLDGLRFNLWREAAGDGLLIVAALLLAVIVFQITGDQEQRAGPVDDLEASLDDGSGSGLAQFTWGFTSLGSLAVLTFVIVGAGSAGGGSGDNKSPVARATSDTSTLATSLARPTSTAVPPGTRAIRETVVGSCFNKAGSWTTPVNNVEFVPCEELHDQETFALIQHPAGPQEAYPGLGAVLEFSLVSCADWFADYVGASFLDSGYVYTVAVASEFDWSLGERWIACNLVRGDEQRASGSARNGGSIVPPGLVPAASLEEGDCFDTTNWFDLVRLVPCASGHDAEVYAVLKSPAELGAEFTRGADEARSYADGLCGSAFASRVGSDRIDDLEAGVLTYPAAARWHNGQRSYVCGLWAQDLGALTGSRLLARARFDALAAEAFGDSAPLVDFPGSSSWEVVRAVGSTQHRNEVLSLTTLAPTSGPDAQAGAAWWTPRVEVAHGFQTAFVFQLEMWSWFTIGDGFAFVIQNADPAAVGEAGSGIGYKGMSNSIAVEFDTLRHSYEGDPKAYVAGAPELLANHVSVHTGGTAGNTTYITSSVGWADLEEVTLADRAPHVVYIEYVPGRLSVFVDEFETPVLTVDVDLAETLSLDAGSAYVGFTAATEPNFYAAHKIHAWKFASVPAPPVPSLIDFGDVGEIRLVGSAAPSGSGIRLTPSRDELLAGAAWLTQKQNVAQGFVSTFQFQISGLEKNAGDGFAFVIQNSGARALGEAAYGIGYDGMPNSIAVEFDTTFQDYSGDPGAQHLGVHTQGTSPNTSHESASLGSVDPPIFLADGEPHFATVNYSPGSLRVYLDDADLPILTVELDIAATLSLDDGAAWVGFTASTEPGFRENHDILEWSFSSQ